jgi:hypothetical protein
LCQGSAVVRIRRTYDCAKHDLVIVGGEQDYDACGSSGTVEGLNPRGDGFRAVKAGPGVYFERIDKLYNGMQVYICGEQGDWFAVVYSQTGSWSERCNVRSLDELFGLATALRICLKSTEEVIK